MALRTQFTPMRISLSELLGAEHLAAVCQARSFLTGESQEALTAVADEAIDFLPESTYRRWVDLLPDVGTVVGAVEGNTPPGASTAAYTAAAHSENAPVSGFGPYRIGEAGRLHLTTKSEHYHSVLGHSFPGYRLIDNARRLGIPNATHNNTRGTATRIVEQELVRICNDTPADSEHTLGKLDTVMNLQTGSLAVEAAFKLVLARFYRVDRKADTPAYAGRTPVFIVVGDDEGELEANYHGTTMFTQKMRGMWPDLAQGLADAGLFRVVPVRPNRIDDLERVFATYDKAPFKIAAFIHELIMMNYGARVLTPQFIRRAYELSKACDAVTIDDEIQSCVWGPGMFTYKEYGIRPTAVIIGKGFPGGEYAGSRIVFDSDLDILPQFGALVTNGQEELASLAYLATIRWVEANQEPIEKIGAYFEQRVRAFADSATAVCGVDGCHHLLGIRFSELGPATDFASRLNKAGLDISVQTYKIDSPPTALIKLPLVCGYEFVDAVAGEMDRAMD